MYACLAVTCHLHFWQNDRDFFTCYCGNTGVERIPKIRVSTESRPLRRKFSRRSSRDSNPRPFNHESGALTTELSPPPEDKYRGISLLNTSSKIYSYILNKRLTQWVEENSTVNEAQAGFRRNYSTVDHIFTLLTLVQKQLLNNGKLYVAFIDFKKAFENFT